MRILLVIAHLHTILRIRPSVLVSDVRFYLTHCGIINLRDVFAVHHANSTIHLRSHHGRALTLGFMSMRYVLRVRNPAE